MQAALPTETSGAGAGRGLVHRPTLEPGLYRLSTVHGPGDVLATGLVQPVAAAFGAFGKRRAVSGRGIQESETVAKGKLGRE